MTGSDKTLLILGGTSDIARATAQRFAKAGWRIHLAGRDEVALHREAGDIAARTGRSVGSHRLDILATADFAGFVNRLPVLPDCVICCIGLLGDQDRAQSDLDQAATILRSNYEGPALILGHFAEHFLTRGSGVIVGLSSVAGDRGRASNYLYGSAKAGFTTFLSGLRNRLARRGVHVITVKPGYVRTRMTEAIPLPRLLTADPDDVAAAILEAVAKRRNVIYVRPVWRLIMGVIRLIPEALFKTLSL